MPENPRDLMANVTNILKRELSKEEFLHFQDLLDSGHVDMLTDLITEQAAEMAPGLFVLPNIVDNPGQPPDFSEPE